ncbi:hypothetical protein BIW11_09894, partial [Tropilaelaps mercedesae]
MHKFNRPAHKEKGDGIPAPFSSSKESSLERKCLLDTPTSARNQPLHSSVS